MMGIRKNLGSFDFIGFLWNSMDGKARNSRSELPAMCAQSSKCLCNTSNESWGKMAKNRGRKGGKSMGEKGGKRRRKGEKMGGNEGKVGEKGGK